jgi:hypothetical protein
MDDYSIVGLSEQVEDCKVMLQALELTGLDKELDVEQQGRIREVVRSLLEVEFTHGGAGLKKGDIENQPVPRHQARGFRRGRSVPCSDRISE